MDWQGVWIHLIIGISSIPTPISTHRSAKKADKKKKLDDGDDAEGGSDVSFYCRKKKRVVRPNTNAFSPPPPPPTRWTAHPLTPVRTRMMAKQWQISTRKRTRVMITHNSISIMEKVTMMRMEVVVLVKKVRERSGALERTPARSSTGITIFLNSNISLFLHR